MTSKKTPARNYVWKWSEIWHGIVILEMYMKNCYWKKTTKYYVLQVGCRQQASLYNHMVAALGTNTWVVIFTLAKEEQE